MAEYLSFATNKDVKEATKGLQDEQRRSAIHDVIMLHPPMKEAYESMVTTHSSQQHCFGKADVSTVLKGRPLLENKQFLDAKPDHASVVLALCWYSERRGRPTRALNDIKGIGLTIAYNAYRQANPGQYLPDIINTLQQQYGPTSSPAAGPPQASLQAKRTLDSEESGRLSKRAAPHPSPHHFEPPPSPIPNSPTTGVQMQQPPLPPAPYTSPSYAPPLPIPIHSPIPNPSAAIQPPPSSHSNGRPSTSAAAHQPPHSRAHTQHLHPDKLQQELDATSAKYDLELQHEQRRTAQLVERERQLRAVIAPLRLLDFRVEMSKLCTEALKAAPHTAAQVLQMMQSALDDQVALAAGSGGDAPADAAAPADPSVE